MKDHHDSSTRSWDAVADDWVRHADHNDYRNLLLLPVTLELLGDCRGRRLLDVGCGEGGYTRELARRGAIVAGVDGSPRLIEIARQRAAAARLTIDYAVQNASALSDVSSAAYDVVLASMSLMDVENYPAALGAIHRVLRPGGELLVSITHPCFSAPISRWIRDDDGTPSYFAVDRYFERGVWDDYITQQFSRPVLRRHRTLEDYIAPALTHGFVLRRFYEPTVSDLLIRQAPRLSHLKRIPYFLFLGWQKP